MPERTSETDGDDSITPAELHARIAAGERLTILDTRDRDEFDAWHVDGPGVHAVQVPHAKFVQAEVTGGVDDLAAENDLGGDADHDGPVVAVCARGEASDHAAGLLRAAGVETVNLAGGMEAWARAYVANEVGGGDGSSGDGEAGLAVRQYVRPSSGCLAYLVYGDDEAIVVDPLRAFADRYVEDAGELGVEITGVVDTHVHADHVSGLREVAERTGATAYLPEGAVGRGLAFDAELLGGGDVITVGGGTVEAMHVPGHTNEMTALWVRDAVSGDGETEDVLLSGDSLFVESVARPDLEAGAEGARELAERLHQSLHDRILELPADTVVAPGHVGPRTTPGEDGTYTARLGALREGLDLLGLERGEFVERVLEDLPPRPANHETIIAVNLGRESVDEEAGFELELGPNNCAVSA